MTKTVKTQKTVHPSMLTTGWRGHNGVTEYVICRGREVPVGFWAEYRSAYKLATARGHIYDDTIYGMLLSGNYVPGINDPEEWVVIPARYWDEAHVFTEYGEVAP